MAGVKGMKWAERLHSPTRLEELRRKIDAEKIVERLQDHLLTRRKMSITQIAAAQLLLRKILPDLSSTELTGDANKPVTVEHVDAISSRLIPELAARDTPATPGDTVTH